MNAAESLPINGDLLWKIKPMTSVYYPKSSIVIKSVCLCISFRKRLKSQAMRPPPPAGEAGKVAGAWVGGGWLRGSHCSLGLEWLGHSPGILDPRSFFKLGLSFKKIRLTYNTNLIKGEHYYWTLWLHALFVDGEEEWNWTHTIIHNR